MWLTSQVLTQQGQAIVVEAAKFVSSIVPHVPSPANVFLWAVGGSPLIGEDVGSWVVRLPLISFAALSVVAPIGEEFIKRHVPFSREAIVVLEAAPFIAMAPALTPALCVIGMKWWFHCYYTKSASLATNIRRHVIWNGLSWVGIWSFVALPPRIAAVRTQIAAEVAAAKLEIAAAEVGRIVPGVLFTRTNGVRLVLGSICLAAAVMFFDEDRRQHLKRMAFSYVVEWSKSLDRGDEFRSKFRKIRLPEFKPSKSHTHGASAADRAAANAFIDRFELNCDLPGHTYQMSKRDQSCGREGNRFFMWSKDLLSKAQGSPWSWVPRLPMVHRLVDVDYYVDLPDFLAKVQGPTVLYHFSPTAVAYNGEEMAFTFNRQDEVTLRISGGATYTHKVWNTAVDTLLVVEKWYGIPWTSTVYVVERRPTHMPHHELVCFVPFSRLSNPIGAWLSMMLSTDNLKYLSVHKGDGYLALDIHNKGSLDRSIGFEGQYVSYTTSAQAIDGLVQLQRASKVGLNPGNVRSILGLPDSGPAALVSNYVTHGCTPNNTVIALEDSIINYQFNGDVLDEDVKTTLRAICNPIVPNKCWAPLRSSGNDASAIEERVVKILSAAAPTEQLERLIDEFMEQFVPEHLVHTGFPVDDDVLYERQSSRSQRRIIAEGEILEPRRLAKMFMKAEAYAGPKPPRVISTMDPVSKTAYSKYMYASYEVFHQAPWYAFGLTPRSVAAKMAEVCSGTINPDSGQFSAVENVVETDCSRMDGRVSRVVRLVEERFLRRFFHPSCHTEILALHSQQFLLDGVSSFGHTYKTGYSRCSGSAETAQFNSLINAFMGFCAKYPHLKGVFMYLLKEEIKKVYQSLGIYGGDDGVTPNVDPERYVQVCEEVGQILTSTVRVPGQTVTFLARVFGPEIWTSSVEENLSSCCDIPRQLYKLHATPDKVTDPIVKFAQKIRGFQMTDRRTPIFSVLILAAERLIPELLADAEPDTWWSRFEEGVQFPNFPALWYWDYVNEALPGFDFDRLVNHCEGAASIQELMSFPICFTSPKEEEPPLALLPPPVSAVHFQNVVPEPPTVAAEPKVTGPADAKTGTCFGCGGVGHYKSRCPTKQVPSQGRPKSGAKPKARAAKPKPRGASGESGGSGGPARSPAKPSYDALARRLSELEAKLGDRPNAG